MNPLKYKRVLLFCGEAKAFVIFEFAPKEEDAKIELDALLADWMESEDLILTDTSGLAVLDEATPDYLQELGLAWLVSRGKAETVGEPRRTRLKMLHDNAVKYFPQDIDGL